MLLELEEKQQLNGKEKVRGRKENGVRQISKREGETRSDSSCCQ
jgi:hypothetical protein